MLLKNKNFSLISRDGVPLINDINITQYDNITNIVYVTHSINIFYLNSIYIIIDVIYCIAIHYIVCDIDRLLRIYISQINIIKYYKCVGRLCILWLLLFMTILFTYDIKNTYIRQFIFLVILIILSITINYI